MTGAASREPLFPAEFFQALEALARRQLRSASGHGAGPRAGRGLLGFEHRAYRPGDALRHVDWRATARAGRPHVRLREEERGGELLLLLDRSASLCPRHARRDHDQRRLALALGWLALEAGGHVRLLAGERPARLFAGFERRAELQRALAELAAAGGLDAAWPLAGGAASRRAVFLGDPWSGEAQEAALAVLARGRGECTWVTLVLPEEDALPADRLALEGVEGTAGFEADLSAGGAAFRRAWERWLAQRRARVRALGWRPVELRCAGLRAPAAAILAAAEEAGLV